jgi:methionyl aminopeptidase
MIYIKSEKEIERMRRSNSVVMEILIELGKMLEPGMNIKRIERKADELATEKGGIPAFKGYNGYPSSICVSINEVIIHGIPHDRLLKEGDLVGLDFGILIDGFYGDAAITVPVGEVNKEAKKLLGVTEKALYKGINKARPGNRLGDISYAIQSFVEKNGFSVIRDFTGHGIGRKLHEEPSIPNFGKPSTGVIIEKGMTFAIEPMVAAGSYKIDVLSDGWTVVTKDRSLSAHFEHTIAVTEGEPEILSVAGKAK